MNSESFLVPEGESVKLKKYATDTTKPFTTREDAAEKLERDILKLCDLQTQLNTVSEELDSLKSERKQVRTRIEKLLGQMDLLSAT